MKKIFAMLLVLAMVVSMAACGEPAGTPDPTTAPEQTQAPASPSTQATPAPTEAAPVVETRPNRIIYGSTTGISGDIGPGAWWTNNADDNMLRGLINDYQAVVTDQGGQYVINTTVCGGVESVLNEDGTKTFTVKINEGLKFSNGEPITAANYAANLLIGYSPAAAEAGAKLTPQVVGTDLYQKGEATTITGMRLIDEYTYAVTIMSDYVPYYYELAYAAITPLYIPMYASAPLTVKDDGEGVYFDGGELVAAEIDAARWMYADAVSAGPYKIVSIDTAAYEAVLEINPHYAGNFEGQKPSIEQIVMIQTVTATQFDALSSGEVDLLSGLTDGAEINTGLDYVAQGGYVNINFERNGYGKIQFQCDAGPTQFQAVRHAVAYLLDRNEFANTFCQGYGAVVHGPYGVAMWMYKDSEELFAEKINTYEYNPETAVQLLEADGWVLNADGTPYSGTGTRYKKVTAEEAGTYPLNVTLSDGTILMPLHIMWSSSENNPVSDLIAVMLANGEQTAAAGMVIEQTVMTFDELLLYMYRDATQGEKYGVPTYGMYNLATNFTPAYDQSYSFTLDPELVAAGWNTNYILDEQLDKLSMDMVYGVDPSDSAGYLKIWQDFILRWNELLPEIPLYSNVYVTIHRDWLENYNESSLWSFEQAILYASIANAE